MTALTTPARPDEDHASLRPIPWRRMAGVTWRQHRIALAGVAVLLGALAGWLWIIGMPLDYAYAAAVTCHPASSVACQTLVGTFNGINDHMTGPTSPGRVFLQVVPVLIGAFVGAPVLARELETGTFRYAWTQGFGRWPGRLPSWYSWRSRWPLRPARAACWCPGITSRTSPAPTSPWAFTRFPRSLPCSACAGSRSPPGQWPPSSIGALAGMLIRRVVPAIVATLAVYAGLAIAADGFLREHYLTPLTTSSPNVPGTAWVIGQWWTKDGRFAFAQSPFQPPQPVLHFGSIGAGQAYVGNIRAVPRSARLHDVDQLPARQPVLALPVDRGRLAARALGAAHRGHGLAGRPARGLMHSRANDWTCLSSPPTLEMSQ